MGDAPIRRVVDGLKNAPDRRISLVYFGLGSNIGDREEMLRSAIDRLQAPDLRLVRTSSIYETEPVGFKEQPWFLNMVAEFESNLFPHELLDRARRVEEALGRQRSIVNGPRTIDVDLLLCGDTIVNSPDLTVPHPRYLERKFVLEPLLELDSTLIDPVTKQRLMETLAGLG
jgi:2-amino-4-hydroxy-6-hydroxymethyldihydropteridine diphosphokinase